MPAFLFAKINSQIGSPKARNVDSKSAENKMLVFIEKLIFAFIDVLSFIRFLSISLDSELIDGIMVTANDPINVAGIIKIGKVIPIMMPNSERASVFEKPKVCKRIGIIIAIIDDINDEIVRTAVIGELVFNKFLNSFLGFAMLPPDLKYINITINDDMTQARVRDKAVLFVEEMFINEVLNKMNNKIILIICSRNSVMLIAKNFCSPQSAPLRTS